MRNFFKMTAASTIGFIIASIILGFIGFMFLIATIAGASKSSSYTLKDQTILKIDLTGSLADVKSSSPLDMFTGGKDSNTLTDIVWSIKKAKENKEIEGIYINAGMLSTGIASLEPVREALLDFKESGKFIFAYADHYSQGTYYLASVADKIALNPSGAVEFHGLGANPMFTRGLYEKMGVKYQVFKVGTFKSAVEPYIQDKMSDENRLQTLSYMNSIWGHWLENISASRNISVDQLNAYADEFLGFQQADSILAKGMVDTLMYSTGIEDYLKNKINLGKKQDLRVASVSNMNTVKFKRKIDADNKIAILYAEGAIMDDGFSGSPLFPGNMITPKPYLKELKRIKEDESIKALVFRVNSPGGSAYASEQIWNAVAEVRKVKPVIVSMGTYAASGGYYISTSADTIVAEPTTITGSIGIFGMFPNGQELANKLGLSFDEVKTNDNSAFGGGGVGIPFIISAASRGLNDVEQAMLQKYVEEGYELFLKRCADGRSMTRDEIDAIGQGRVWTGIQALENGLVDVLGGLDDAVAIAKEKAGLDDYAMVEYPRQKEFIETLLEQTKGGLDIKVHKFFLGEEDFKRKSALEQIKNTDFRQAVMPESLNY